MSNTPRYCIRWKGHQENLLNTIDFSGPNFGDVTLLVANQEFKVHRKVATACSPVIGFLLNEALKKHEEGKELFVVLPKISLEIIKLFLEYFYYGVVYVEPELFPEFLYTANMYQFKGIVRPIVPEQCIEKKVDVVEVKPSIVTKKRFEEKMAAVESPQPVKDNRIEKMKNLVETAPPITEICVQKMMDKREELSLSDSSSSSFSYSSEEEGELHD